MFKLSKKPEKPAVNISEVIEEIHHTFYTAGDKLLASALEIINQTGTRPIEKVERLKKVGFINSNEVEKWEQVTITNDLVKQIERYQWMYPDNKFITGEQVAAICKKYNLVCAPLERYKGFVPESKLKQIENLDVCIVDMCPKLCKNVRFSFSSQSREIREIKEEYPDGIYPIQGHGRTPHIDGVFLSSYDFIDNQSMVICAPSKDIYLGGLSKISELFLSVTTVKKVSIPDPVVLQPVKGGFLIVCAWGDEASDEIVVNEKMN